MKKAVKRTLITVLVIVLIVGAAWGGLLLLRKLQQQPVNVYAVSELAMTDYWGDSSETYGTVTTDKLQKVYLSGTQTVSEIFVSEGQTVQKGDKLLVYDTTLSELDVTKAEIALEKRNMELDSAKKELTALKNAASREYLEASLARLEAQLAEELAKTDPLQPKLPPLPLGDWTEESPRYVDMKNSLDLGALLDGEAEEQELWVVLVTVSNGEYAEYIGLHLTRSDTLTLERFTPDELEPEGEPVPETETAESLRKQIANMENLLASSYSYAELVSMQNSAAKKIEELQLEIRLAETELKQKRQELSDGSVVSQIDGVVKAVRDPSDAYLEGQPVIEVSGGGGYYITGSLSELELDTVQIGQTVDVSSWMSGGYYTGEIVEIGSYPTNNSGWSSGNSNVSWYPMTVFVDESANLQEYEYVSISYQSQSSRAGAWYLESMFIRTENGMSYVYVQGENGTLERRRIGTGADLWGSYTEIRGGLSLEDRIAFPYGRDVTEGAATVEATIEDLYSGMYY